LLLLSALLGVAGVVLFGAVHALAIVPIWRRLPGGLPFALVAALGMTCAFHTLHRAGRWALTLGAGLRFGALFWVADLPATLFVNVMRLVAAPAPRPVWVDPLAFGIAAASGATVFGAIGRRWNTALAGGIAIGVFLAMAGGVVPVVNGRRAAALWAGFLIVKASGGALLALGYRNIVALPIPPGPVEARARGPGAGMRSN
jgi:hypothetical protein